MKYDVYADFFVAHDLRVFEFVSIGKCGSIPKRIAFVPTELPLVYNLAFGDVNEDDEIEDNLEFLPFHKNMKISAFLIKRKIA